jgi:hypothetical protein
LAYAFVGSNPTAPTGLGRHLRRSALSLKPGNALHSYLNLKSLAHEREVLFQRA